MGKTIGARIVLEGESEFKQAVTSSNRAMATMKSELGLVTAQYSKNANGLDALRAKQDVYIKLQDEQKKKISALTEVQSKAKARYDEEVKVLDTLKNKQEEESKTLEKLKTRRDSDNRNLEEAKKQYGENSTEVKKLTESLEKSEKEYQDQEKTLEKATKDCKTQEKALTSLNNKIEGYSKDINNASTELIELSEAEQKNAKYLDEAQKAVTRKASSLDEYGNEIKKCQVSTVTFGSTVSRIFASQVLISGLRTMVRGMGELSGAVVSTGSTFELSMSTVSATMNIASEDIKNCAGDYRILEEAAREAGKTTKFSAKEAADAENYLALAGYEAAEAAQALPDVLTLAAAGAMDLAYASDLVTDSMSALGLETKQLTNFTDQMAVTSQKSNTNIAQLGEAILTIGGTAKQLAGGTVELNTELGILADNGIKGAEGGTALRNILKNLTAPTDAASDTLAKYNIQVYDATGAMRPLNETFQDLGKALDGLSDQERAQVMNEIFDSRNLKSAEALIANCGERFDELSGYISDCDGAAKKMADTMSDNLDGKTKKLGNTLQDLGISIYSKFEEPLESAVDTAIDGIGELEGQLSDGKLGHSIDNLATSVENASGSLMELGIDVLPTLINAVSWVIDNGNTIVSIISAITAAKVSYRGATVAATVAQSAFNIATNLNPYVKIASLAIGAATAIGTYALTTKTASDMAKETTEDLDRCAESLRNTRDSAVSLEGELATSQRTQYIISLKNELIKLNEAQADDVSAKKRVKEIVSILNNELPNLNLAINEQSGYIDQSSEAISANVDSLVAWSRAQAMQEKMVEVAKAQADADFALYEGKQKILDINLQLQEVEREKARLQNMTFEGDDVYLDTAAQMETLLNKENELTDSKKNLAEAMATQREESEKTSEQMEHIQAYIDGQKDSMDDATRAAYENADAQEVVGDAAAQSASQIAEAAQEVDEAYTEMYDKLKESIEGQISLFEEFNGGADISKTTLLENMKSQIDGLSGWADDLEELANRADVAISQGFLQSLADMGPQGASYVRAFTEMSTEELQEAINSYEEAARLPADVTTRIMTDYEEAGKRYAESAKKGMKDQEGDLKQQAESTASKSTEGLATGQEKGKKDVEDAAKTVAESIPKTIKKELGINGSESKETKDLGESAAEGIAEGQKNKTRAVESQAEKTAKTVVTETKKTLSKPVFIGIGEMVDEGLAQGISNGKSKVVTAIKDVAKAVVDTANKELDIHSPSKKLELTGMNSGLGFVNGWRGVSGQIIDNVRSTMSELENIGSASTQSSATAYVDQSSISQLAQAINGEISAQLSGLKVILNANADVNRIFDVTVELNNEYAKRYGGSAYDVQRV